MYIYENWKYVPWSLVIDETSDFSLLSLFSRFGSVKQDSFLCTEEDRL
jgi:hypothetical protein